MFGEVFSKAMISLVMNLEDDRCFHEFVRLILCDQLLFISLYSLELRRNRLRLLLVACEHRQISGFCITPPKQIKPGNPSVFVGYASWGYSVSGKTHAYKIETSRRS